MLAAIEQKHRLETSLNETLHASLLGAPTIKTFNLEGFLVRRLEPLQERLAQAGFRQEATTARLQNLSGLFAQLNQLLIVSFGGWMVINQDLSSGALAACTLLSGQVTMPLGKLFAAEGQQASQWQANHDYQQLEQLPQEPNLLVGDEPPASGTLELPQFTLPQGGALALVGGDVDSSSALLKSITALEGELPHHASYAGRPLQSYQRSLLRRRLRLLVPTPQLSTGTLLENLTHFRSDQLGPRAAQLCEQWSARGGGRARTTLAAFARRYPVCKDLLSADAPAHGLGSLSSASCWRMKGGKPVARGYCRSLVVRIRAHSPSCPVAFHWGWRRPFPQDRACIVNRGWQRFVDSRRRLLRGRRPPGGAARLGPPRPELPLALAFETEDRALARAHHG